MKSENVGKTGWFDLRGESDSYRGLAEDVNNNVALKKSNNKLTRES